MEIKYLYFEIHEERAIDFENRLSVINSKMENENVLLLEPHTNSKGVWSFRTITDRYKGKGKKTGSLLIDQYWIDFSKFEDYRNLDKYIKEATKNINRKINIKSLGI